MKTYLHFHVQGNTTHLNVRGGQRQRGPGVCLGQGSGPGLRVIVADDHAVDDVSGPQGVTEGQRVGGAAEWWTGEDTSALDWPPSHSLHNRTRTSQAWPTPVTTTISPLALTSLAAS